MRETPLMPPVFKLLIDSILEEASSQLKVEGLMDSTDEFSLQENKNRLFGTGTFHPDKAQGKNQKKTIAYAIHLKFSKLYDTKEWHSRFNLKSSYDPRKLQDLYATYNSSARGQTPLQIKENYLQLFMAFVGYATVTEWIASCQIDKEILDQQHKLLEDQRQNQLTAFVSKSEILYYWCHIVYKLSDSHSQLYTFPATFSIQNKTTKVRIWQSPEGDEFNGELKIKGGGKEALITLLSNDEDFARPMAIVISQQNNTRFMDLDVCMGQYITIRPDAANIAGPIVFEKRNGEEEATKIDAGLLQLYLGKHKNIIVSGGFLHIADFQRELNRIAQEKLSTIDLYKQFANKFFRSVLLTKKGRRDTPNEQFNRIELSYFTFGERGEVSCSSIYPAGKTTYVGQLEFHSLYKAIILLHRHYQGQYQIVIDLHHTNNLSCISGVYSGITQDGTLAAGRVRFYLISQAEYEQSMPEILELHEDKTRNLLNKYPDLKAFLSGNLDNHLDNAHLFFENPGEVYAQGNQVLQTLPGTYYYYRTRTIKGHIREVKRYPLLIEPSGNISVKIKADGEEYIAYGKAIRKNDRVYMHLHKKDRYDGLAILYPNWYRLGATSHTIQAVYASTSKSGHLMAGRMVLLRLSNDITGREFDTLTPDNIDIDQAASRPDVKPEERIIIEKFAGQINNYIAIRHPSDEGLSSFGNELFAAACYYAGEQIDELALQSFQSAIMWGGFNDLERLRKELGPQGRLYALTSRIKAIPATFDIASSHGEDQREYLQRLFDRVFEQ
ncbi:MAG: hypothetical protein JNK77_17880 [Saprospiraceae bacterium]|nr:hypothetical protein [Saprospiraceae bacterium]